MLSIQEFKAVFDAAPDGYVVVASDGTIRAINPRVEKQFGWTAGELIGEPVEVLLPERVRTSHVDVRERFTENPHVRPMGAGLELRAQRKDGTTFPVEVSLSPWRRGEDTMIICSIRDVTEVRRLRNFSEEALRATEDERQRIAHELHDDTAQRLATLILRVRQLAMQSDDERRARVFEEVRQEIIDTADGVRRMARGLRPPEIAELGLGPSLVAYARTLREAGLLHVSMDIQNIEKYLDPSAKLSVYRIIQEAVSNARRHSGVDSARVSLRMEADTIVAEVTDEGCGFDLDSPGSKLSGLHGLGLIGMQERAMVIGGRVTMTTVADQGTTVRLEIPVSGPIQRGRTQDG